MTSRRNTIQKDLVRNTVYEMRRHVTANEVYEFIKEAYPTIGKGTVYRNDGGVIMKVSISKSKNTTIYYLSKSVRIGSKTTTKTIEKIGTYDEIKEKCK